MKRLLLSTLFTLFAVAAFAQKGTVTGTVVDADTGETVAGAVPLEFAPRPLPPTRKQYSTSGFKGAVSIPSLAYGEYKLVVSFLGYNNAETIFKVSAAKQDIGKDRTPSGRADRNGRQGGQGAPHLAEGRHGRATMPERSRSWPTPMSRGC